MNRNITVFAAAFAALMISSAAYAGSPVLVHTPMIAKVGTFAPKLGTITPRGAGNAHQPSNGATGSGGNDALKKLPGKRTPPTVTL